MRLSKCNPRSSVCCILLGTCASLLGDMVSPDGKWVAYTVPAFDDDANLYSEVFLKSIDDEPPRSLGRITGELDQVIWMGNGRIALSQFAMGNQFAVVETTGKRLPDIVLPPKCNVIYMTLSPDAQNVAFTGWRNLGDKVEQGLFVWRLRQNGVRLLIEKGLKTPPAWSPDSSRLAIGVAEGYEKNYPLQIVDVNTGKVDDTGVLGVGASWSPDGKLIACTTAVRRGGSWHRGIPTDGKLGIYDVERRAMQILEDTEGATMPAWSGTGSYVAYLSGGSIWILPRKGGKPVEVKQSSECILAQLAWAGDSALHFRTKTCLGRVEVPNTAQLKIVEWDAPRAPELKPDDFKVIELPRVTVRYARFDRKYAEAFGKILLEALNVYEALGFKMPRNIELEAQIDPSGNQLWTDGEAQVYLHLQSREVLAPASRTGVFNLYGMCHELGHIAMYRNLKSLIGLPSGVGEGWAHYAGSIVVTEVAAKLGKSIWPEYYDIAKVEGVGRLQKESQSAGPWDKMDPVARAALAFYRIETESGREKLATAMSAALGERPTGKELMPLMLAKLRQATSDPTAAAWIPESLLVPRVEWMTKEPKPSEDFFADQKQEQDSEGYWVFYDDGTMEGKQSMSGSAETMLFRLPEGSWQLDGIKVFGARYGADEPPQEDISIYICDAEFKLLHELQIPYARFERGDEKWHSISFAPVNVAKTFYLGMDFHATATKGVYVGMDKGVRRSHSRIALPYAHIDDLKERADWMIRPHISPKK